MHGGQHCKFKLHWLLKFSPVLDGCLYYYGIFAYLVESLCLSFVLKVLLFHLCRHSMKIDNSSIERVEDFKYLGTTLTNKNSIQEEIKIRLKVGNACYYSVHNLLSSSLLSKKLKIKIYIEL